MMPDSFVAIDFETADRGGDSACAVGLVRVEAGVIVARGSWLIRPPRSRFLFTYIHKITWAMVKDQPTFAELWPELRPWIEETRCLVAHNATFDRGVLHACCQASAIAPPLTPFFCSMWLARRHWGFRPAGLSHVCGQLNIALQHHNALSDAEAAARIVLAARESAELSPMRFLSR